MPNVQMVTFHMPTDPEYLQAVGRVCISQGHLDYSLKLLVKTMEKLTIDEALEETDFAGPAALRKRILKAATKEFAEGTAFEKIKALLQECKDLTGQRNKLIHELTASDETGVPLIGLKQWKMLVTGDHEALNDLSSKLTSLARVVNKARRFGFINSAMQKE